MRDSNKNRDIKTDRFKNFLLEQNQTWEMAAGNYRGLNQVEEKEFLIDGYKIKVQFNPQRIRSSAAKVDPAFHSRQKMFLMPRKQASSAKEP